MNIILFDSKTPGEVIPLSFDFGDLIDSIDSVVVAVTVRNGIDASPIDVLFSTPEIKGARISQLIKEGLDGVIYMIRVSAISGDLKFDKAAYLPVTELF